MISLSSQRATNALSSASNSPTTTRFAGSPGRVALALVVAAAFRSSRSGERRDVAIHERVGRHERGEVAPQVIDFDAGHGNGKREFASRAGGSARLHVTGGAIQQVARRVERDVDHLGAGVPGGEHEPFARAAGRDRPQMEALRPKELVHPPIGTIGRDQLEGDQEQQRQKEHPAHQPERGEPLGDRKMVRRGGLERGVVVRVDLDQLQAQERVRPIDDPQVHRLDAAAGEVDAEEIGTLGGVEHGDGHLGLGVLLRLGARRERTERRVRRVRRRQNSPQRGSQRRIARRDFRRRSPVRPGPSEPFARESRRPTIPRPGHTIRLAAVPGPC